MSTQLDVYNLALLKLAQSDMLASTADEAKATDVMNRLWEPMRDLVLEGRIWPFALKAEALALDVQAVQLGWGYRYGYPNDCITAVAVTDANGLRAVRTLARFCDDDWLSSNWGQYAFDWDVGNGDQGTCINTDVPQAYLVYVSRVEDTGRFPASFVNALAARIAAEAGPGIIGEAGLNNKSSLLQEYNLALTEAGSHAYNEASGQQEPMTPSLAARGA